MKAHILVVEDDPTTRTSFACRLQYAGYRVTEAPDGETALDLLEHEPFDVVVTDIIMGDVDGMEVLHTARLQTYQSEVIILTGHGSFDTAVTAVRKGAYDYLVKPCSAEHVLQCVESAVRRHKTNQQVIQAVETLVTTIYPTALGGTSDSVEELSDTRDEQTQAATAHPLASNAVCIGAISLGKTRKDVLFEGKPVRLTPIEFVLLHYLAERAGQVCYSSDIVQRTHKIEANDTDAQALIEPHIYNLRKKFAPEYFLTERGIGYRLVNPSNR